MRVALVAVCCTLLAACEGPVEGHAKKEQIMTEGPTYVEVGPKALRAWAELSESERDEARRAFRMVARMEGTDVPEPSLALFVLDEDLPANTVASIVADPTNSEHQLLAVSRRTYSYAATYMAAQVLANDKAKGLLKQLGRLNVTNAAVVVAPDGRSLFEVEMPEQSLLRETESLSHMITVATSSESADVPNVGRGQLYRFDDPARRK